MCNKCNGVGYTNEYLQNGTKLVHACPSCDGTGRAGAPDSRREEPRRMPRWMRREGNSASLTSSQDER
ncbi:hypothetical protein GCM10010357_21070 [Streptomyces luteireticuli]|uniref:Molecular chaperone DnaJ n=1 Tax=Streptomyces luteireticuli TaxID=173858 RepID=A0ABN0YLX0_9ACTN